MGRVREGGFAKRARAPFLPTPPSPQRRVGAAKPVALFSPSSYLGKQSGLLILRAQWKKAQTAALNDIWNIQPVDIEHPTCFSFLTHSFHTENKQGRRRLLNCFHSVRHTFNQTL